MRRWIWKCTKTGKNSSTTVSECSDLLFAVCSCIVSSLDRRKKAQGEQAEREQRKKLANVQFVRINHFIWCYERLELILELFFRGENPRRPCQLVRIHAQSATITFHYTAKSNKLDLCDERSISPSAANPRVDLKWFIRKCLSRLQAELATISSPFRTKGLMARLAQTSVDLKANWDVLKSKRNNSPLR